MVPAQLNDHAAHQEANDVGNHRLLQGPVCELQGIVNEVFQTPLQRKVELDNREGGGAEGVEEGE